MTPLLFTKAEALGNDFVIIEESSCRGKSLSVMSQLLSNRRKGVGCDQVIFYSTPKNDEGNFFLRFFNADGSEAEACGNGTRAFAFFASKLLNQRQVVLKTMVDTFLCDVSSITSFRAEVSVWLKPGKFEDDSLKMKTLGKDLEFFFGERLQGFEIVDVGNPHLVLCLESYTQEDVENIGSQLTCHPVFPKRVNVGFVKENSSGKFVLQVFERGVGPTPACGTGAYAAYLVAQKKLTDADSIIIHQEGGSLTFSQNDTTYESAPYKVTGEATLVFQGEYYL